MERSHVTKKVNLVIERTSNGLNYDYVSAGLNKQELGKLKISFDETNEVGQFNQGYCYSIKQTDQHLIYSIINTDVKDSAKRNGFFAIRLIVNQNEFIDNIIVNLGKVTTQYITYFKDNTFNNQNYDALLAEIGKDVRPKYWITPKLDFVKVVYYQFININENQSALLNNLKLSYADKVYFLNNKSAQSDGIARQFGFQPLSNFLETIKEIRFTNPNRQNITISINAESISVNKESFVLVCRVLDDIKYKTTYEKHFTSLGQSEREVLIKQVIQPILINSGSSSSHSNKSSNTSSVLPWVLGLVLGMAAGYFGRPDVDRLINENITAQPYVEANSVLKEDGFGIRIDTNYNNKVYFSSKEGGMSEFVLTYNKETNAWKYFKDKHEKDAEDLTSKKLAKYLDKGSDKEDFLEELKDIISTEISEVGISEVKGQTAKKLRKDGKKDTKNLSTSQLQKSKPIDGKKSTHSQAPPNANSSESGTENVNVEGLTK